jgi:hypothetical protein
MSTTARRVVSRVLIGGIGFALYTVGGGSLLTHLLSGAVAASNTSVNVSNVRLPVVITLSAFDSSRSVVCVTSPNLVAGDELMVTDFDLESVYKELGCRAPET